MVDQDITPSATRDAEFKTATKEKDRAEARVVSADDGLARTSEVVGTIRALVSYTRIMHEENHYVERMLPFFRGTR